MMGKAIAERTSTRDDQPAPAASVIDIRIMRLDQLFNTFDPSPFHERDIDDSAEEHIVSWARELDTEPPIRIVIHLPQSEIDKAEHRNVPLALSTYFNDRAGKYERDVRELFRLGRQYLSVGIPVLVFCLLASQYVGSTFKAGPWSKILQESLVIVGWVTNWKPLETFLYEWRPIRRRARLYRRIAAADVEVRPFA